MTKSSLEWDTTFAAIYMNVREDFSFRVAELHPSSCAAAHGMTQTQNNTVRH